MSNLVSANSDLPLTYPLTEVAISILHQTGHGISGGYQVTLNGDGRSFYSRKSEAQQQLTVDNKALLELINNFYQIHFFELADTYSVKKQVILQDNGTLATVARKILDTASHKLCIKIADYQKCVTVIDNQPATAAQLVKKIEAMFPIDKFEVRP
ncbi:MAG: hypothetical protein PHR94_02250 [Methylomonas lenta]|nr:hypothetical protein [Methylomonas lenta]